MNVQKQEKGFTIIEVVLVLAIAALIFLMIFVALPALQRGQRDTARKNDVNAIASAINTYRSNNRGSLADMEEKDITGNISQIDPTAVTISDTVPANGGASVELDAAIVYTKAECADTKVAKTSQSSRKTAIVTKVEGGDTTICQEG